MCVFARWLMSLDYCQGVFDCCSRSRRGLEEISDLDQSDEACYVLNVFKKTYTIQYNEFKRDL